jgi:TPR repeat protein
VALTDQGACRSAICVVLLGLSAIPAGAVTPEDGRRAYDAGRFTDAMGIWAELRQQGNAAAAFGLGMIFDLGNGTPADPESAFLFYMAAANAGLPAAEFNVAAMYDSGRGAPQSREDAAQWYAKAAAHGHHRAQFALGMLYEQGDGVPLNRDAAASWFRSAADGGLTAAGTRLKALGAMRRRQPDSQLQAVILSAPTKDAILTLAEGDQAVELVWLAPAQPQAVHYDIQVQTMDGSTLRTVVAASVDTTAALIRLPPADGFYAWNVETVGQDGSHAPSVWGWFSVGDIGRSQQSAASIPAGR